MLSTGVSPAFSEANSTSSSSSRKPRSQHCCFIQRAQLTVPLELIEIPYAGNRTSEINVLDNIPRSTKRKLGEAPLWTHPPPTVVKNQPPVIIAPEAKKRSWGFRRTNPTPAVAVH